MRLAELRCTLAVAESCTGGLLGGRITSVPGCSRYFLGGVIAYADAVKRDVLGVPEALLSAHGAVSAPVACAMAEGVRARTGADYGVSVTGIAGPEGGTPEKPVGLVYVGLAGGHGVRSEKCLFAGSRDEVRRQTVDRALGLLTELLRGASAAS
jgi:PncC family amidohydrolase